MKVISNSIFEIKLLIVWFGLQIPPEVVSVLANHRVIKLGVAVLDDANKLREDYGIMVRLQINKSPYIH